MAFSQDLLILTGRLHLRTENYVQPLRWKPATDILEGSNGWLIKLELAGVRPEDVRLRVCENFLAISGRRVDEQDMPGLRLKSMEIVYSEFERGFEFPVDIENARILTEFRNGMLLVRIIPEACR